MLVKFRISSSLKKLSKKILPLGFSLCLANSSVLNPTTTATTAANTASTEISIPKKSLFDDFKISKQLSERIKLLSTKYEKNTNYQNLSDLEKQELFDVQNELFTQLKYNPFKKFDYEKPIYGAPVIRQGPYYYEQDPRFYGEWWGTNLWVNLTVSETETWINGLKKYYYIGKYAGTALDIVSDIADNMATITENNEKISFIFKVIYVFAVVGRFFADYFNWEHLSELSASGGGKISYRFTFGFIPSGVHPGYN